MDLNILYEKNFLNNSQETLELLLKEIQFISNNAISKKFPRMLAAYGDNNLKYDFSNISVDAKPWTTELFKIKKLVEKFTNEEFNFCLINYYPDGKSFINPHKDNDSNFKKFDSSIAIISLGQEREMHFTRKYKDYCENKYILHDGSILVLKYPTNKNWFHSIPINKSIFKPRLSLTFRSFKVE